MNGVLSAKPDLIVFDKTKHGRELPKGSSAGEARKCWSMFRQSKNGYHFMTIEIANEPAFYAVTEEQMATLKTLEVVAVEATATWDGRVWHIRDLLRMPVGS